MNAPKALEVYDGEARRAEAVASALQPAVAFLGNWMTLFLAPPLVRPTFATPPAKKSLPTPLRTMNPPRARTHTPIRDLSALA